MSKKKKKNRESIRIKEIITTGTVMMTVSAFLLRTYWYVYQLGYCKAMDVNWNCIAIDSETAIFHVLYYLGAALILVAINYFVYICVIRKQYKIFFAVLLIELLILTLVVFVLSNVRLKNFIDEMIYENNVKNFVSFLGQELLIIVLINVYGIIIGTLDICSHREHDEHLLSCEKHNSNSKYKKRKDSIRENTLLHIIICVVLVIVVEWGVIYCFGLNSGNNQRAYKYILEKYEDNGLKDKREERYVFTIGDCNVKIYPILYENSKNYIISYLYKNESGCQIEKTHQRIVAKENIETRYTDNLFAINENETIQIRKRKNEKSKGGDEMLHIVIAGVLSGIISGGIVAIIANRIRSKKNIKMEKHAAARLYYDLKKIEQYMYNEDYMVNLRYSNEWEESVKICTFLKVDEISSLYNIYDMVYNLSQTFEIRLRSQNGENKENYIGYYTKLKEIFFKDVEKKELTQPYKELIEHLGKIIRS